MLALSGTVGAVTLTVEQIASHGHAVRTGSFGGGAKITVNDTNERTTSGQVIEPTGGSQSHNHSLSGTSGSASNLPLYYSLSYIMRIL